MTILLFLLVLAVLIFVHELGHFAVAKLSKIRVDEFSIGFPPRLLSKVYKGTRYSLNLIPFGGYVSIFGEDPNDENSHPERKDSFVNKSRGIQAAVLGAGVTFNLLFAWFLISVSLMIGSLVPVDSARGPIEDEKLVITYVLDGSPAQEAGLAAGQQIVFVARDGADAVLDEQTESLMPDQVRTFIRSSTSTIALTYSDDGVDSTVDIAPELSEDGTPVIGIGMERVGYERLGLFSAIVRGFGDTYAMARDTVVGTVGFLSKLIVGQASVTDVSGPVGIAGMVGDAAGFGFAYLLGFTAFISVNLAVMNLLPFPALDGGRILFVAIEAVTRRRIPSKVANTFNLVGFGLLMLLMVAVTWSDVAKLF